MRKFAFIALFVLTYSGAIGQEINLKQLYKVYDTGNIDTTFKRLSSIVGFAGRLIKDSLSKASKIEGKIGLWKLTADIFKDRGRISLKVEQNGEYQTVFVQAKQDFYAHGNYVRGSKTEVRQTYSFSDKQEMNDGDLWLLLTQISANKKTKYFEVQLRKYPYNDTD